MYVNDYTRDYGETGREAVREFLGRPRTQRGYLDEGTGGRVRGIS